MEPPKFVSIPLCPSAGPPCTGAAFKLQDAARESEIAVVDGWEAQVIEGMPVVVARGGLDDNYDDAFRSVCACSCILPLIFEPTAHL